jgi:hypothetical protein
MNKYAPKKLDIEDKIDNLFEMAEELFATKYDDNVDDVDDVEDNAPENRCDCDPFDEDDGRYVDLFCPAFFILSSANKAKALFRSLVTEDIKDEGQRKKMFNELLSLVVEAEQKYLADRFDSWTGYEDSRGCESSMYMIGNKAYKIANAEDGFTMEWRDIDKQEVRDSIREELSVAGDLMHMHGDL